MNRREFIAGFGGAVGCFQCAQAQANHVESIGAIWSLARDNPEMQARMTGFDQGLERFGWFKGRNLHLEERFAEGNTKRFQSLARDLVALRPKAIVAQSTPVALALLQETRSIPIVFFAVSDPVGSGLVSSLGRPGANATGVLLYEEGIVGKWLAMLKEVAPRLTRVALVANPKTTSYDYFFQSAKVSAFALGIELVPLPIETAADVERAVQSFAAKPYGGLALPPDSTNILHRDLLIRLANKFSLPAVYPYRSFVTAGGLMSYSTDVPQQVRLVASFVDRILRGAKASDLPVETPTRYETTVNITAAKALGLELPRAWLALADEVVE
jgi:putative ABC transport system substrate-binding protein